ncbi:1-phosphatidylinositol 4,5-bisphosphate phosphodiesterase classes I and II [Armadillidium vulgare]|nr:1-phosphatidylinositol 4,5-bisphosphate phosphodiesterase classes I and II [Armadillidium vulgare]
MATVRIAAYEENSKSILGHRVLPLVGLRPGYKHICLRNEKGQTLGLATLFVHIKVGDYVPDGLSDFAEALANPIKYQNEIEKRSHQLEVFEDDDEKGEDGGSNGPPCHTQPSLNNQPDRPTPEPPSGLPGSRKSDGNTSTSKPDTPPARRQNSICQKPTITAKGSEERATVIDLPPLALDVG